MDNVVDGVLKGQARPTIKRSELERTANAAADSLIGAAGVDEGKSKDLKDKLVGIARNALEATHEVVEDGPVTDEGEP